MAKSGVIVLGIETSCDETAAAIVRLDQDGCTILGEHVHSQTDDHAPYGGVVPEIAARAHVDLADHTINRAMSAAGLKFNDLDGVAATTGPGLIGGVLVGMMTGKAIAQATGKTFISINHLEGHALSPRLTEACEFPYLLLLVSGGHCQFLRVDGLGQYQRLGTTLDDAAGECFDKVAKMLGLGFPGGPEVEKAAEKGNPKAYAFPRPLLDRDTLDMSFSGLKSAVARVLEASPPDHSAVADICASFQAAATDILIRRTEQVCREHGRQMGEPIRFVIAGGVAANTVLRTGLETVATACGAQLIAPPLKYCTDNAAMIALAGAERMYAGQIPTDGLSAKARPRWPLDETSAVTHPAYGGGKRGAKA